MAGFSLPKPGVSDAGEGGTAFRVEVMPTRPQRFGAKRLEGERKQVERVINARRGSARARGYTSAWDKAAKGYLRSHPLCVGCEAEGLVVAAELVDHVVPHKGDQSLFWDVSKWQAACRWHHDAVKQALEIMWARGGLRPDDLHLASPKAVSLARSMRAGGG